MKHYLFCLLLLHLLLVPPSNAQIYVDGAASGANNGTSWTNAYTNLSPAIATAVAGNEIWVAAGTYTPAAGASYVMKEGIKVYGGFLSGMASLTSRNPVANVTILDGNGNSILSFSTITSATVLDGFTISGGTDGSVPGMPSAVKGGGITLADASPVLSNLIIKENTAVYGGGIVVSGTSSPAITNVLFLSNTAERGSGIYITGSGSPVLTSVIFQSNTVTSTQGGALHQSSATNVTITNAVFYSNTSTTTSRTAGIYSQSATSLKITNTVFAKNVTTGFDGFSGGAITNNTTDLTISDCTFYNNDAGGTAPPEIRFLNCTPADQVNNCVFFNTGETASTVLVKNYNATAATAPTFNNCYLPSTTGSAATFTAGTGNVAGITSPFLGTDPMDLAALQGADGQWMTADDGLHLLSTSTAHNAGNNSLVPSGITADIKGAGRIQNTTVEMGAYESSYTLLPVQLISFTGSLKNGVVLLEWQTAAETNIKHFELQRSPDAQKYTALTSMLAKGNNSRYGFSTKQREPKNYYRLQIVDRDEQFAYSNVLALLQQDMGKGLEVYPNPARAYIVVSLQKAGTIKIYDETGRLVKSKSVHAGIHTVNIGGLAAGIHFCEAGGEKVQFIKQ